MEGVLNQLVLEHLQLAPLQWGESAPREGSGFESVSEGLWSAGEWMNECMTG